MAGGLIPWISLARQDQAGWITGDILRMDGGSGL